MHLHGCAGVHFSAPAGLSSGPAALPFLKRMMVLMISSFLCTVHTTGKLIGCPLDSLALICSEAPRNMPATSFFSLLLRESGPRFVFYGSLLFAEYYINLFFSETRMRFRLMLSLMSTSTAAVRNF